jgi:hypothetical protein
MGKMRRFLISFLSARASHEKTSEILHREIIAARIEMNARHKNKNNELLRANHGSGGGGLCR